MHLPTFIKKTLLYGCFSLISLQITAKENNLAPENTDKRIIQLYHSLNRIPKSILSTRITIISAQLLGKPYLLGALGEGVKGEVDTFPLYRMDAFDCETLVDTVLALAFASDPNQFKQCINQIRYYNGHVSFIDRNHFTDLDWNRHNQALGFVRDITTTILNKERQPVAEYAHAFINKPAWYSHFSIHNIRLNEASLSLQITRLQLLKARGLQMPAIMSTLAYIPLSVLFDHQGKANMSVFKQIPNAAIIEIVRPNWDLRNKIGTHLNVSHLGFAIWKNGVLFFREASSEYHRVIDVPLIDYLAAAQKSPTIKGINIQIALPQRRENSLCMVKARH